MRRIFYFIMPLLFFGCDYSKQQKNENIKAENIDTLLVAKETKKEILYKEIDRVIIDLNNDSKEDTIILFGPDREEHFTRVVFNLSGSKNNFIFDNEDGWETVYPSFLKNNQNKIKSKNIFIYNSRSSDNIILLCGQIYEVGTASTLFLINNDKVDRFNLTEFENPTKLTDWDKDGIVNIIGNNIGEMEAQVDSLNADIVSYRPYFVYDITAKGLFINKELTKEYNEKNYVWAGLDSIGEVRLLQYRDGRKPKVIK